MNNPYDNSEETGRKMSLLTTPLSAHSVPRWLVYLLGLVGLVYMLNPTAGILELLPDNLPIIGNLDEGVAFMFIWASLVEFFEGRKRNPPRQPSSPDQK
jgi:hypothetical protein